MNGHTSGTQATRGHTINHDPEPWRCPECDPGSFAERMREPAEWCGLDVYDPRPEYTVRDNPILVEFRNDYTGDMTGWGIWLLSEVHHPSNGVAAHDLDHIRHARRVLEKLAALHNG